MLRPLHLDQEELVNHMGTMKRAQDLDPGDRIVVQPGDTQTITDRTELDKYGGCTIFTDRSTILVGLPCPVKVLDLDETEWGGLS